MRIIETSSDGLRNAVQSTSSCDLSHPDQATTPHDGAFGWVSDFLLDLNGLIDLKCFPHVPELPPEGIHYRIRRIPVQVNHLSTINICMK